MTIKLTRDAAADYEQIDQGSAPAVSGATNARFYFDSARKKLRLSAAAGAYEDVTRFVQSAMDEVTGDVSTASVVFTDLLRVNLGAALSVVLTTGANFVLVQFSGASSNALAATARNDFRLLLDGVPIARSGRGGSLFATSEPAVVTIRKRVAVTAGVHTFKVQWKSSSALGSAQIRAATVPDEENAEIVAEEVTQ